jgi:predicted transcriptional regulator of viral defense system
MGISLQSALTQSLGKLSADIVSDYQLAAIMLDLYQKKSFEGEKIDRIKRDVPDGQAFSNQLNHLLKNGVLKPIQKGRSGLYALLDKKKIPVQDVACTADVFGYVAFLSAMTHHGITDKFPRTLYICTLPSRAWHEKAEAQQKKEVGYDSGELVSMGLPHLKRFSIPTYNGTTIVRHESAHYGGFVQVHGRPMRVASIGRTFLDMLRKPDLCGGISHVINVFRDHAPTYKKLIINEFQQHGSKIDKVRAGYLLDEVLGILDEITEAEWLLCTQRGGSQKLDAKGEYYHEFSEKWSLSINVPIG